MSFDALGLPAELLRAIGEQGYTRPTPVQEKAIPVVLEGRDVLAGAQTGTGKTAAFTLPILARLRRDSAGARGRAPRALVLTPTRELAAQVAQSALDYGRHVELTTTVVFGGVGIEPQKAALRRGTDILVATPGRLLDLVQQRAADLSGIEILVLDEADRMLDMGFIHDIRKVIAKLPKTRQNLLFSATYSDEIRALAANLLVDPAAIDIARRNTAAETVTQRAYRVEKTEKRALLAHLIEEGDWFQVLVFARTKHGADRLAKQLTKDGLEAAAIHGNKSQGARTRALSGFKAGELRVLVATDIAARGLDIDRLPYVVNFELPNVAEDYVHRIGRTGRAGETGTAVSLVAEDEDKLLAAIERLTNAPIERIGPPAFERGAARAPGRPAGNSGGARPDAAPGTARKRRSRRRNRGGNAAAGTGAART